ncbi:Monocopper oxidase-like protein SKS2 [Platanthera guangdongensis]|uniref:Monocopper oxidase-like protein SKS2 n=1 Tax=Platanthera guangdongensis TaxID=2320717 RepID=A0ABR2M8R8_9ASPA
MALARASKCLFMGESLSFFVMNIKTFVIPRSELRKILHDGSELGMPDGVLFNGLGPFRYNVSIIPDGILQATINTEHLNTSGSRLRHAWEHARINSFVHT